MRTSLIWSSTLDQTGARGELRAQPARGGQAPRADGVPVRTAGQPQGALRRHHALHPPRPAGRHQAALAAATEAAATRLGSSGGGSGRRRLGQRVTDEPKERGGRGKQQQKQGIGWCGWPANAVGWSGTNWIECGLCASCLPSAAVSCLFVFGWSRPRPLEFMAFRTGVFCFLLAHVYLSL